MQIVEVLTPFPAALDVYLEYLIGGMKVRSAPCDTLCLFVLDYAHVLPWRCCGYVRGDCRARAHFFMRFLPCPSRP